jgi:hypothetical protein
VALKRRESMFTKCPVCGEELWADGHITPDGGEFWGPVSAGYCPKCKKYYYWRTGELVSEKYRLGEMLEEIVMYGALVILSPLILAVRLFKGSVALVKMAKRRTIKSKDEEGL